MRRSLHKAMPVRRLCLLALGPLPLAGGCVSVRPVDNEVARARIGETVRTGPVTVTPTALVEDSRCPQGVQCIQTGTVRITAALGGSPADLTLGTPVPAAGGTLSLVEAYPPARAGMARYPDEYRFGFRWDKAATASR